MTDLKIILATDSDRRASGYAGRMDVLRLLIVDDCASVRQGLVDVLTLSAAQMNLSLVIVGAAANGLEAIDRALVLQPDVILMDLEMPILDGYTAIRVIKDRIPAIRIVALSVNGDPSSRNRATQAGADAFQAKGSPLADLLLAIVTQNEHAGGQSNGSDESSNGNCP